MNQLKRNRKKLAIVLFFCCLTLVLSACNNKDSDNKEESKNGELQSLTIALGHGLDYLGVDPYGSGKENTTLRTVLFEPLAIETEAGQFEGGLAEDWSVNEVGTEWTFQLRENVSFHDGTPFTSSAVKTAFEHYMEDPLLSKRLAITNIDTPDDFTVIFTLQRPFAPFLNVIGSFQCTIPSPTSFDENGNLIEPIGTGPFKLKTHTKERVEFIAYENHWRGKPGLDELNVVYIADQTTMILALESGEVDLIGADGYGVSQAELKRLQENSDFTVVQNPDSSSLEWVGFNLYKEPLNDINVRQAINLAINREEIAKFVYEGFATPAVGPIGFDNSIPWVNQNIEGYEFDLDNAKQLLEEAGWTEKNEDGYLVKDGKVFELSFLIQSDRTWKPTGEVIQKQLADVGIKVNLELLDNTIIRDSIKQGNFNMAGLGSMGKSAADPYYFFQYYFTKNGAGTIVTDHEKLDTLVRNVVTTIDQNERQDIYNEIQQEVMNLTPGAFIVHPTRVTVMKKDIQGWEFSGTMDPLRLIYKVTRDE